MIEYDVTYGVQTNPDKNSPITRDEKWCDFKSITSCDSYFNPDPHIDFAEHCKSLRYTIHFFEIEKCFYPPKPLLWRGKTIEELHNQRLKNILQKLSDTQINQAKSNEKKT